MIGKVGDHLVLGLLWWLCSLPIVTAGAATTAMTAVSFKIMENKEYRLFRDFFSAFKENFRISTLLWLAYFGVGLVLALDWAFYYGFTGGDSAWPGVVLGMFMVLTLFYLACLKWVFPYAVRSHCRFLQAIRFSFMIGMANLGYTALMLAMNALLAAASLYASFLLPFLPGLMAMTDSLCLLRVFGKYTKKMQAEGTERKED